MLLLCTVNKTSLANYFLTMPNGFTNYTAFVEFQFSVQLVCRKLNCNIQACYKFHFL